VVRHRASPAGAAAAAADTVPAADSQDAVSEVTIPAHSFRVFHG
jgi:hypothetical protein